MPSPTSQLLSFFFLLYFTKKKKKKKRTLSDVIFCVFLIFQFLFMGDRKWPSKRYLPSNPWDLSLPM